MAHIPQRASVVDDIFYPDTDGEPMAESDFQRKPLMYMVEALAWHFRHQPEVYVSGNMLLYYEAGNPRASISPDVFVVLGVPKHDRRIYQVWREGKGPDLVVEITSHTTRSRDEATKPALYQQLGVQEYFQYDPTGDYLHPALKGRRLDAHGIYQALTPTQLLGGILQLESQSLGVALRLEEDRLRLFDPVSGAYLLTYDEEATARREAETQTQQVETQLVSEVEARQHAEARTRELEAEIARLRAQRDAESS